MHKRATQHLASLATPSTGDNILIVGQLLLAAEEVLPLVTDEDENLTKWSGLFKD